MAPITKHEATNSTSHNYNTINDEQLLSIVHNKKQNACTVHVCTHRTDIAVMPPMLGADRLPDFVKICNFSYIFRNGKGHLCLYNTHSPPKRRSS
jgi:hypothetical protein